nr:MAG TPA: hypothetical protein [Caudoviricetes sp.]
MSSTSGSGIFLLASNALQAWRNSSAFAISLRGMSGVVIGSFFRLAGVDSVD